MILQEKILHFMRTAQGDFNELALAVFLHQYTHCSAYQHYCQQLNITPERIQHWRQIPSVPTDVFREFTLCTFNPEQAKYVFQTSGTTQENKGKHYYQDMTLYDEAIRLAFMRGIGLSNNEQVTFRILTPSFHEVSTSSLFYMLQKAVEWFGDSHSAFYMKDNIVNYMALKNDLEKDIKENRQIALIGTAFSFVNLFDQFPEVRWQLPQGSVLMETGGLKGRAREISQQELYELFTQRLGILSDHCFSEYGMTELSSQCYSKPHSHIFTSPHWMPTRLINPETGLDVDVGEKGIVTFFDLANKDAISAITTADLALKHADGFELLGRAPKAVLRGCSTLFENT